MGEYREGNSVLVCTRDKITIANRVTVQLIVTDASVYQGGVINWFNVARSFALVSGNAQVWSTKSVATGGSRCGDMVTLISGQQISYCHLPLWRRVIWGRPILWLHWTRLIPLPYKRKVTGRADKLFRSHWAVALKMLNPISLLPTVVTRLTVPIY